MLQPLLPLLPGFQAELADLEKERCGLIVKAGQSYQFIPSLNVAEDPTSNFAIEPSLWRRHKKTALAIAHSHPGEAMGGNLTPADIESARALGVGALVYHSQYNTWDGWHPKHWHPDALTSPEQPESIESFLGLPFEYGRSDCWSLVRAWYRYHNDWDIRDYARGDIEELDSAEFRPFVDDFQGFGFASVSGELVDGDLVILQVGRYPTHCGVIAHGQLLHHPGVGCLSRLEPVERWLSRLALHLRYTGS